MTTAPLSLALILSFINGMTHVVGSVLVTALVV